MNLVTVFFCKHLQQLPLLSEIMRKDLKLYNQLLLILYGNKINFTEVGDIFEICSEIMHYHLSDFLNAHFLIYFILL